MSRKEKAKLFVGYDDFKILAITDEEAKEANNRQSQNVNGQSNSKYRQDEELGFDDTLSSDIQKDTNNLDSSNQSVKSIEYIARTEMPKKKFCDYCNLEQPYRTKHCKQCERCVRKFDHHCFWIGGCVGELNHRKFWAFLLFQTIHFTMSFNIAMSGYTMKEEAGKGDKDKINHIGSIWAVFQVLSFTFILFAGILFFYHTYLIMSGQTTWEHSRRGTISYLSFYPIGILPFYQGIKQNIISTFFHGNQCTDWELKEPFELKQIQGFNLCENELYSCC